MGLSINLRGDLAKLSDAELAARLEQAWQAHEIGETKPKFWMSWFPLWWSRRGPIRHPRIYRFLAILSGADVPAVLVLPLAWIFSSKAFYSPTKGDQFWVTHLAICEIRDIEDEIKRRLANRKRTRT